jgi:sugar phosphate isomerase/epimerase
MYQAFAGGPIGVRVGFEESVELAAHFGFRGVYLDTGYVVQAGPEAVVQMFEERGLEPAGWGLPVRLFGTEAEFREGVSALPAIARACAQAGALRTSTWVLSGSDEMTYDQMYAFLKGRLAQIGRILKDNDVRLGLEFIGPKTSRDRRKHQFIYTMDAMLDLCADVGTGNLGLLLDAWHLYTGGGEMDDVLRLTDEQIVNVHINDAPAGIPRDEQKDGVRCLPGETGVINLRRFLECLVQIGYTGPVMAEPFSDRVRQMPKEEAIRATKEAMDSVWPH